MLKETNPKSHKNPSIIVYFTAKEALPYTKLCKVLIINYIEQNQTTLKNSSIPKKVEH